jgi:hypothetical protein
MQPIAQPPAYWPNAAALHGSRLQAWMNTLAPDPASWSQAQDVMVRLLLRYACSQCLFLACAVARVSGRPHRVVRFTKPVPGEEPRLLHAVLCLGSDGLAPDRLGLDLLGVAPLGRIAGTLETFGVVAWDDVPVDDLAGPGDYDPGEEDHALQIAGCLPWLAEHLPARYRIGETCALACLTDLTRGYTIADAC